MGKKSKKLKKLIAGVTLATLVLGSSLTYAAYSLPKYIVGRQADGSVVVPTNQIITPAGQQVEFPGPYSGRPNAVAVSPDGRTAAFLTAAGPLITTVNLDTGAVQGYGPGDDGASFDGILYSPDGRYLYASDVTGSGSIWVGKAGSDGALSQDAIIPLPNDVPAPEGVGAPTANPGGLALSPDGKTLYVALNRNNTLGIVDLTTNTLVKQIPVGNAPHSVVVDGNYAYVTDEGGRRATNQDFTVDSAGTPMVANPTTGAASTGTVSVVDLNTDKMVDSISVGLHPTAMNLNGRYLFVANTNSDTLSVIDTGTKKVVKSIDVKPYPNAPIGSSPNALLTLPDGRLVVSFGIDNALAVYAWDGPAQPVRFDGLIPTGWYPGSLALDAQHDRIVVANIKGVGSLGPETTDSLIVPGKPGVNGHNVYSLRASTSLIPYPNVKQLSQYTAKVVQNNHWDNKNNDNKEEVNGHNAESKEGVKPVAIPRQVGDPSLIKHVFYIIKENTPYDTVLGDDPRGNGEPALTLFGKRITPNHHALAKQFPLFDNLYVSGELSADGHNWTDQAFVPDYLEKGFDNLVRGYAFQGFDSLAYGPGGFLWSNAVNHGKSAKVFGEYADKANIDYSWSQYYQDSLILEGKASGILPAPLQTMQAHSSVPSLDPLLDREYPPFHTGVPDQYRADIFLRTFDNYVKQQNLPNLMMMTLGNDHTTGVRPGMPTPNAAMADNDLALGRIVDAISHSPYWDNSAIFVIEDDAQSSIDHVDGHRTMGYVISPYTLHGNVDHTFYNQIDMVRTIEQILGIPPMNQMDMAANPMRDVFTNQPDFTPYTVLPNNVPLDELNPQPSTANSIQNAWAVASAKELKSGGELDTHNNLRRHAIWYSTKGFDTPYPGDKKVLLPNEVNEGWPTNR